MTWGNEKHMRETIRLRRGLCADLRKAGHTWREIAGLLDYSTPYHAHIDWCRGLKRPAKISKKTRATIDSNGKDALPSCCDRRPTTSPCLDQRQKRKRADE